MKWFSRKEKRESGGSFADAVVRLIEAQAAGTAGDAGSSAAVEAASGALSRAFASAEVQGPGWAQDAISPTFLAQAGRDLVRSGESMHRVQNARAGGVQLIPCASWHFDGDHDPSNWRVRATAYGPSTSTTWNLPFAGVIFVAWGATPGMPYTGTSPHAWAGTSSRLHAQVEKSLGDEASGPIAQLLPIPKNPSDAEAALIASISAARGGALTLETTASGFGKGPSEAPRRDWIASRLGPHPPEALVRLAEQAYHRTLAAMGCPPALFESGADGTAQREALRRWHMNTVMPLARILERELREKLEVDVKIHFDGYAMDLVSRASVVDKLVRAGVDTTLALSVVGMNDD